MRVTDQSNFLRRAWLCAAGLFAQTIGAQSGTGVPNAPPALQPPSGQALLLHLKGKGQQVYVCASTGGTYVWKLKGPEATLLNENGQPAGRHFIGPAWEFSDGSRVVGKLTSSVPSPDSESIAWLLLTAKSHEGKGIMAVAQSIQRLNTKGGIPPGDSCGASNKDAESSVPYEADYYFYGPPAPGLSAH